MNLPSPQAEHRLGEHRATYLPTVLPGRIMLGVAIASLLFSLLPFSIVIEKSSTTYTVLSDRFRRDSIMINTIIGVTMLLLAVILFALYYHHKNRRVDVYVDGFVFTDWRKSLAFRWDDVSEVYASPIYRKTSRGYRSNQIVNWTYTVHRKKDGQKVKISGLEGIGALGQTIQTEVSKWLLPWAMDAYQAGDNVRFGPRLGLSKRGIHVGESLLPWPDVEAVNLNRHNAVTIRQKDKRTLWKYISSDKVANSMVLKAMIRRVSK